MQVGFFPDSSAPTPDVLDGFRIHSEPSSGQDRWQVSIGDPRTDLLIKGPIVSDDPQHVALRVKKQPSSLQSIVSFFMNGILVGEHAITNYFVPGTQELIIGIGNKASPF